MTAQQFEQMDPFIALSIVNMKLRDFYDSLEGLSDDWGIDEEMIKQKLSSIGYRYHENTNQFICEEV